MSKVLRENSWERSTAMADRFWKIVPAAFKIPTLDEPYKRLRDLDYTQVDERLAVMLNVILQLESQGECRESATKAVLMEGYLLDGISNQEQTRWLSWNVDGGVRGFDLARRRNMAQKNFPSQPNHWQRQGPNLLARCRQWYGPNKRKSRIEISAA